MPTIEQRHAKLLSDIKEARYMLGCGGPAARSVRDFLLSSIVDDAPAPDAEPKPKSRVTRILLRRKP